MYRRTAFEAALLLIGAALLLVACGDDDNNNPDTNDVLADGDAMGQRCGAETCGVGQGCCDYVCVDLDDIDNCGACGNSCEQTETCTDGECRCGQPACGPTDACCDAGDASLSCIDVQADKENCGACGNACDVGQRCLNGTCACLAGDGGYERCDPDELCCPGIGCRNLDGDPANCGSCGATCGAGEQCDAGRCGCGAVMAPGLGAACGVDESCCGSPAQCVAAEDDSCICGPARCIAGQACCDVGANMQTCVRPDADPEHCGSCGTSCGTAEVCRGASCRCAGGFADCDMDAMTGCESSLAVDFENCGGCGQPCAAGEVCDGTGRCALNCQAGMSNCDGSCINIYSDERHCGACTAACPPGQVCDGTGACDESCQVGYVQCGASCFDIYSDGGNCGACGVSCTSGLLCDGTGQCDITCQPGFSPCGGGCWNTDSHRLHCGACNNVCPSGEVCNGEGTCALTCVAGYSDCGGSCVDTDTTFAHCGACGVACRAGEVCVAGACQRQCPAGQELCDGTCVSLDIDDNNCGTCGTQCGAFSQCISGTCQSSCPSNRTICGNACVDTLSNGQHCGGCGMPCAPGESCQAGSCLPGIDCGALLADCSGSCVNLQNNPFNCGTCGTACGPASLCNGGLCECLPGFQDCNTGDAFLCETNTNTNPTYCGGCAPSNQCDPTERCLSGTCTCTGALADCDGMPGCEVSLTSDSAHCGGCNMACAMGETCISGFCQPDVVQSSVVSNRFAASFGVDPTVTCVVDSAGAGLTCAGVNRDQLMGNGGLEERAWDVPQPLATGATSDVAMGADHACAVRVDGTAVCWGTGSPYARGCTGCATTYTPVPVDGIDGMTPSTTATHVVAGYAWTCYLMADGSVACSGLDQYGVLGNGVGYQDNAVPAPVQGIDGATVSAVQLVGGYSSVCALIDTGAVWCWGLNYAGQNASGDFTTHEVPTPTVAINGVTNTATRLASATNGNSSGLLDGYCAILDTGAVMCWGDNSAQQLDIADTAARVNTPTLHNHFDGAPNIALDIAGGENFFCAIAGSGDVWCWGQDNGSCLFGVDDLGVQPATRIPSSSGISRLAAGQQSVFGVKPLTGTVVGWGWNQRGVLGLPSFGFNPDPGLLLRATTSMAADLTMSAYVGCIATATNSVECWGRNRSGTLGLGVSESTIPQLSTATVNPQLADVAEVAISSTNGCARHTDGRVSCWGDGVALGSYGPSNNQPVPMLRFDGVTISAAQIDLGTRNGCAVTATGSLRCWGTDSNGELGNGSGNTPTVAPELVSDFDGVTLQAAQVAVGGDSNGGFTCARTVAGAVYCWGLSNLGQTGNNSVAFGEQSPVQVVGIDGVTKSAVHIAAGLYHACAILSTGAVECWGYNDQYQVGTSSFGTITAPVQVDTLDGTGAQPVGLGLGDGHSCAVFGDGSVKCWGSNRLGELGTNNGLGSSTWVPQPVTSIDGITLSATQVEAGAATSCARLTTGETYCWGDGDDGILGNDGADKICQPTTLGFMP